MDKVDLIRAMREAYQRLAEAIEHAADEQLLQPAMDDWTGKDLLAHMAWWHDHSVRVIEALRAGREPYDETDPANTTDAFNERTHREHLDDPPELTRREFNESFRSPSSSTGRSLPRHSSQSSSARFPQSFPTSTWNRRDSGIGCSIVSTASPTFGIKLGSS